MREAWTSALALAAGVTVTIAVLPQLAKALRSDEGLASQSFSRHVTAAFGNALWAIYAISVGVLPLSIMASMSIVLNAALACLILRARHRSPADPRQGLGPA